MEYELYNFSNSNNLNLDKCINDSFSLLRSRRDQPKIEKQDLIPFTYAYVNTSLGRACPVKVQALLDSGGTGTIMRRSLASKLRIKKSKVVNWATLAGSVTTASEAAVEFSLPEFYEDRTLKYNVHLTKKLKNYDLIIGRDLLSCMGMDINFSNSTCSWDERSIPMRDLNSEIPQSFAIEESKTLKSATKRLKKILDAKYEPVKIDKVVFGSHHLDFRQTKLIRKIVKKI